MKNNRFLFREFIIMIFMFTALYTSSAIPSSLSDSTNLIQNSSFEINGQPTLASWTADTSLAKIVQGAPLNGGSWSLQIMPGWVPQEGYAMTYITGQSGLGIYEMSVWCKSINHWAGNFEFGIRSNNTWVCFKRTYFDTTDWTEYSITDTLSLQPQDTIAVKLSAGITELANGSVLFDLVRLQKTRTITNVKSKSDYLPDKYELYQNYPNPFNPATKISYQLPVDSRVTIKIYDILGREAAALVNNREMKAGYYENNFNGERLSSGIYIYRLTAQSINGSPKEYSSIKKMMLIK